MQARMRKVGFDPDYTGSDPFRTLMRADYDRWGAVIRASGIVPE